MSSRLLHGLLLLTACARVDIGPAAGENAVVRLHRPSSAPGAPSSSDAVFRLILASSLN